MADIYFLALGKQNLSPIYFKIFQTLLSIVVLIVNPRDKKKQCVRNLAQATQKDLINTSIEKLS
ncbi:hypothetical protein [Bacteroidetes bacterium endosymbiont of Geopemphigus sp.]|uniref:hypothetical protein n=1 Tax=Bacteroidetes bacterium endosymbiont of Geopemphigus sp. TaxID=2047937 RepID=UPI000CD08FA5|nr:hypothetical protein [Bacteroidetes bacterium endosymbiont of Geopemphigus sp.]